jgi:hypothetical protein
MTLACEGATRPAVRLLDFPTGNDWQSRIENWSMVIKQLSDRLWVFAARSRPGISSQVNDQKQRNQNGRPHSLALGFHGLTAQPLTWRPVD